MRHVSACLLLLCLMLVSGAAQTPAYRPAWHFSPQKNWTNDPNGLVYFQGEHHLFFQYNPFGDQWGHMSWGHAVSRDLVHWQELPLALAEENGVMIFTGSVVVDRTNSSGFCKPAPCLVAIYTGHESTRETQHLAYSNDRGRTWTKFPGNPVLDRQRKDFRDPHVLWHAPSRQWIMTLAVPDQHKVEFYASPDLRRWQQVGEFGNAGSRAGIWECPSLNVIGDRWLLTVGINPGHVAGGSGTQYFIGKFNGQQFENANPAGQVLWLDHGSDNYCTIPFHGTPRVNMLGWMSNWQYANKLPTSPWRGQMTLAREVDLIETPAGWRVRQTPILPRLQAPLLRGEALSKRLQTLDPEQPFILDLEIEAGDAQEFGLLIRGLQLSYDARNQQLVLDRNQQLPKSPEFRKRMTALLRLDKGRLRMRLVVDRISLEVFAEGTEPVALTALFFPDPDAKSMRWTGNVASVQGRVQQKR